VGERVQFKHTLTTEENETIDDSAHAGLPRR
jgi:hypothetical protein